MSEQFILNTIWKHENKIDEQASREYLAFIKAELDPESEFWLETSGIKLTIIRTDQFHFMRQSKAIKK